MDDRGVSTALGYVLTLAITLLLVVSLFAAATSFVEDSRDRAVESQLSVVGNKLAGELTTADTLVRAADSPTTITVRAALPESVAGHTYRVTISDAGAGGSYYRYDLRLESDAAGVSTGATIKVGTPIRETTVSGGDLVVRYTGSELEVQA